MVPSGSDMEAKDLVTNLREMVIFELRRGTWGNIKR